MTRGAAVIRRAAVIRARLGRDEGSILPLIAVFAALAIALVLVVTAATSLYLERKRLFTVADAAALAGAESYPLERTATGGEGPVVRLDDREVRAAVEAELARSTGARIRELRVVDAGTADGRTASVTLSGVWRPPVVALFVPDGVPLEVTATARSVFR